MSPAMGAPACVQTCVHISYNNYYVTITNMSPAMGAPACVQTCVQACVQTCIRHVPTAPLESSRRDSSNMLVMVTSYYEQYVTAGKLSSRRF